MKRTYSLRQLSLAGLLYLALLAFPFGFAHAGLACEPKGKKVTTGKKATSKQVQAMKAKHPLDIFHK
jgi:hypothetical protein